MNKLIIFAIILCLTMGGTYAQEEPDDSDPDVPVIVIPSSLTVDFDTVAYIPPQYREPIVQFLNDNAYLLTNSRLSVTAMRQAESWLEFVLVPTYLIEGGWDELEINASEIMTLIAYQEDMNSVWIFAENSPDFDAITAYVPSSFMDLSPMYELQTAEDYLFPWTKGQLWYKTQGWHSGNALDFQPVNRSNPNSDFAVLASKSGRLSQICNDGYQSALQIQHGDGTTLYVHLAANSVRTDLLGQTVARGQFLGLLYNGTQGQGGGYQYQTSCGRGTAVHLHFALPSKNITIDGQNANTVASSASATTYNSSNSRLNDPTPIVAPSLNNLVVNASFELGGAKEYPNWSWINSCSRYTYTNGEAGTFTAYDGQRFLATAKSADYPDCQSVYQDVFRTLNVGEKYTLALHLRSGHGPQTVPVALWATGSTNHESATIDADLTDQWQCFQTTLTINNTTNNRLRPQVYLNNMGKDVHIDNVRLVSGEQNLCGSGTPNGETGAIVGKTYVSPRIPLGDRLRVRFDLTNEYPTAKTLDITLVAFPASNEYNADNNTWFVGGTQTQGVVVASGNTISLEGYSRPTFDWNQSVYDSMCSAFDARNTPYEVLFNLIIDLDEGFLLDLEDQAFSLALLVKNPDQAEAILAPLEPFEQGILFIVGIADTVAETLDILDQAQMYASSMNFRYRVNVDYKVDGFAAGQSMPTENVQVYVPLEKMNLFTEGINKLIFAKTSIEPTIGLLPIPFINKVVAAPFILSGCSDMYYSTIIPDTTTTHDYFVPAMYSPQELETPESWNSSESVQPLVPYLMGMLYSQRQIHEERLNRDGNLQRLIYSGEMSPQEAMEAYTDTISSFTRLVDDVNKANEVFDMLEMMMSLDSSGYDYSLLIEMINQMRGEYDDLLTEQSGLIEYTGLLPVDLGLLSSGTIIENSYGNPIYLWPHIGDTDRYEIYIAPSNDLGSAIFYDMVEAATQCNDSLCFLDVASRVPQGWLTNGQYSAYIRSENGEWSQSYDYTLDVDPPAMFTGLAVQPNQGNPTIMWDDHQDAAWFQIEIKTDTNPVFSKWYSRTPATCDGTTCSIKVDLNAVAGTYQVSIRSWNPGGFSVGDVDGWNGPVNLTLSSMPPDMPTSMTGTVNEVGRLTMSWTASPRTLWYQVWLGTDVTFEGHLFKWYSADYLGCENSGTCLLSPELILPIGDYVWYLQPWGPGGLIDNELGGWVEGGRFRIDQ